MSEKHPEAHYVQVPEPVFHGVDEKNAYEDAWAETPRLAGESLVEHLESVVARAKAAASREPGGEG
jgi:hypothetical protein